MPTDAKLGILVPGGFGGTPPTLAEYSAFFRRAEELGYDSLWVIDRIFHPNSIIDPMTLLTVAATVTERVRLGTAVLLFVLRNPILAAKTTSTLDYLSGGRLTLGISLGGRDNEFGPLGVDVRRRVSRFNEGLEVMRRLWSERDVTHHGRYYHMDGVNIDPKPVQQPSIPIIIGGSADTALQRAAEHTDGWVAGGAASPEVFAQAWNKVRDYSTAAGKDPGAMQSAKLIYTYVDPDRDRAKRALEEFTHAYYGPQYDVENACAFGRPEDCAAKLQAYIDSGAKTVMVGPTWPDPAQIERISAEVAPLLR